MHLSLTFCWGAASCTVYVASTISGAYALILMTNAVRSFCRHYSSSFVGRLNVSCVRRYLITEDEQQATYTGREQRYGVWILAFLVAGLFGRGSRKNASGTKSCSNGDADKGLAAADKLLDTLCNAEDAGDVPEAGGAQAGAEASAGGTGKRTARVRNEFDWSVYRAAFPDTPLHAAVTAMFAEYALLVGRITRRLGVAADQPMTLSEGAAIAEHAQVFILGYVNPILGHVRTTKIHRVLCHVLHAVQYHGNIMNGNTSKNEAIHKADKRHYVRTNKRPGYTKQLVRHAHGTRKVLQRNAEQLQQEALAAAQHRAASGDGGYVAEDRTAGPPLRRARTAHLGHVRISDLAARPGLSTLAALLGVSDRHRVAVPSHVFFSAQIAGDGARRQVVRASPSFHGRQWFDHVECMPAGAAAEGTTQFGQVRLIVRRADEVDHVILAEMERVVGADECPLSSRGCTQLRWCASEPHERGAVAQVRLRAVPVTDIVRVVHIVPDCADMGRREKIGVTPPAFGTDSARVWTMRYLLNAFYPDKDQ